MKAVILKFTSLFLAFIYHFMALLGLPYGENSVIYSLKANFTTEQKTDVFCPSDDVWVNGAEYPTSIILSHNGENNGKLLASFEVFDKVETFFRIMQSDNKGESFEEIARVKEELTEGLMAAWEPCLFEIPESMGSFREGTVILGGISLDDGCKSKTQISIWASEDCGKSFSEISIVDSAGGTGDGVWEPWFVYENGVLYCFYSDDSDPIYSQTIVYKSTTDLINWSEKVPVVVHKNASDRPGMPVITKMGNGKYYLCYELLTEEGNMPCRYKISDSISEWNASEEGKEIIALKNRELHTSPVCIWIEKGGKNGMLILTSKYQINGGTELFVSYDYGKTYSVMINPLPFDWAKDGFGYSPAFVYSQSENLLYFFNTVDYKDNLSKIQMARMRVS